MEDHPAAPRSVSSRWILALVGLLLVPVATLAGTRLAIAQEPESMSASLVRRIAEAADALRTGEDVWMTVDPEFPHNISGLYPNEDAALADRMVALGYRVFGPFNTPIDFGHTREVFWSCPHVKGPPMPSLYDPGRGLCLESPVWLDEVASLELVIETTTQGVIRWPIDPRVVDLLVFNVSAHDKFIGPYYARLYGPTFARDLRARLREYVNTVR